ncbi:MAG: hypothetical protein WC327_06655 [Candidatus Cloacimonadia bacterium]
MENSQNIVEFIKKNSLSKYFELLPGFIHNINTPLMSISGRMELVQFKHPEIKGITQMLEQVERLNMMVDNLKTMIEMDRDEEAKSINLKTFFASLDQFLHLYMPYKHKIKHTLEIDENVSIFAKPFNFLNGMFEIFSHAIKNMPNGGNLSLTAQASNGKVLITLKRDGDVIDADVLQKISSDTATFELGTPYTGLLVAKVLMKDMNGSLTVLSSDDSTEYKVEV